MPGPGQARQYWVFRCSHYDEGGGLADRFAGLAARALQCSNRSSSSASGAPSEGLISKCNFFCLRKPLFMGSSKDLPVAAAFIAAVTGRSLRVDIPR